MPIHPVIQARVRRAESRSLARPRHARTLSLESLESRHLLSGESLLFGGIDDSAISPTNAGLILAADLDLGRQVPLHAQVPFTGAGISGLAFNSAGQLFGATSAGPGSVSDLVRIDPLTGTEISHVAITAGGPISIADLAVQPGTDTVYAVRSADDGGGGAGQIYTIDIGSGAATLVGQANTGITVDGGLAFAPDGTLYYTTANTLGGGPVLHTIDPNTATILSTVSLTGSQGFNSGLAWWPEAGTLAGSGADNGDIVTINPATGARAAITLDAPPRGVLGDLAFQPDSPNVEYIHHANFETGHQGYTADNTGREYPGYWHYSIGRSGDGLLNHSLTHSWYYGAFETPTGGGQYSVTREHRGVLISPAIQLPDAGTTILSFSYLLDTRPELTHDFVDVSIDDGTTITQILSRQDGTLPQTGRDKWLTSTYDISSFNGKEIHVRFTFDTGDAPRRDPEGWYVDDVQISNFMEPVQLGSVHGFKFNDVEGNGTFDEGDPLLPNATFTLTEKSDVNGNSQIDVYEATTGADGKFEFLDVYPGDYTLTETVFPAAAVAGSSFTLDLTVAPGEELVAESGSANLQPGQFETLLPDLAVANTLYGSLHGFKFNDINGNGAFDEGDPPLPNATFTLTEKTDVNGNSQIDVYQATSGTDGRFEFLDVYPGDYALAETVFPDGAVSGSEFSLDVTIRSGEELVAEAGSADLQPGQFETLLEPLEVANTLYGSLHGLKFNDVDGNGTFDEGDPLLPNATFTLTEKSDVNGNSQIDEYQATSGADGKFEFLDVYPGDYTLTETVFPDGAVAGSQFSLDVTIRSGEELVAMPETADLKPGQFETVLEPLQVANTLYGSLHGLKFNDVDGNGTFDEGDPLLPNATFTLTEKSDVNGNSQIDVYQATSGADGKFEFLEVYPGDYTLTETVFPGGAVAGSEFSLDVTIRSGEELVAMSETADLKPGQFETLLQQLQVANTLYGSVHGFKFNDLEGNGQFDEGDPPLAGITITLTEKSDVNGNSQIDVYEAVTGPDGTYEFLDVYPGDYTLDEILPAAISPPDNLPMDVTVRSGEELVATAGMANLKPGQFETLLAGLAIANQVIQPPAQTIQFITPMSFYRPDGPFTQGDNKPPEGTAVISGYKWHDVNQNGQWDAGELGRSGWTIFIDSNDDGIFDPQTERFAVTDANGKYTLSGLAAGTYTILEDPAGLSDGTFAVQTFPAANSVGRHAQVVTVADGEVFAGSSGIAETPNFGGFEYSPFVRPADDELGHVQAADAATQATLLAALGPWQKITIANPLDVGIQITQINKLLDLTIPVADQFVTITDANLAPVSLPLAIGPGETVELFAFYDPAVRSGDTVLAQYPDWFDDPATVNVDEADTRPSHTFAQDDRLEIVTDAGLTYQVFLVGGSTYDSDIVYSGLVNIADFGRLDDFLNDEWPMLAGAAGSQFEPTSDINVRFPNGAANTIAAGTWPILGPPTREFGLGDFAPLNVEFGRARSPFLDLDADNSSGARGTGYQATVSDAEAAAGVRIADFDARFANQLTLDLVSMEIRIVSPADGADEDFTFDTSGTNITGVSQFIAGTRVLSLSGSDTVANYAKVLGIVRYVNSAAAVTGGARTIDIVATGGPDFTALVSADERIGNLAIATLEIELVAPAAVAAPAAVELTPNVAGDDLAPAPAANEQAVASNPPAEAAAASVPPMAQPVIAATNDTDDAPVAGLDVLVVSAAPAAAQLATPATGATSVAATSVTEQPAAATAQELPPAESTLSAVEAAWWAWSHEQGAQDDELGDLSAGLSLVAPAEAEEDSDAPQASPSIGQVEGLATSGQTERVDDVVDQLIAEFDADELIASTLL